MASNKMKHYSLKSWRIEKTLLTTPQSCIIIASVAQSVKWLRYQSFLFCDQGFDSPLGQYVFFVVIILFWYSNIIFPKYAAVRVSATAADHLVPP